ncbi:MAG: pilus assembly protein N-terminal domain-containing protein [Proteobacteria bacterium]|nr:pilus assembly protein N-terminal domain-containing protein [Pseudomonadota bacterium]
MFKNKPVLVIGIVMAMLIPVLAQAGDDIRDDVGVPSRLIGNPAGLSPDAVTTPKEESGSALHLTSDRDALLRLDQDAATVIVNNPAHVSVMLDSPRLLVLMPRQPGATSFTVLGNQGEVILRKDVIVSNVQSKYVRIRRICGANDASCSPAAYYYCPDGCYEVTPVAAGQGGNVPPPPANVAAKEAADAAASLGPAAPRSDSKSGGAR